MSQTTPKAVPIEAPLVRLIDAESCGLDNFPMSPESAKKGLYELLEKEAANGWQYSATIQRNLGGRPRNFYVFYPSPG